MKDLSFFQSCTQKSERKKMIHELRKAIEYHSVQYFQKNSPEISDQEFDQLFGLLQKWENEDPLLVSEDSPTKKVGGGVSHKLEKIRHLSPMISLGNVFTKEELQKWEERWKKKIDTIEDEEKSDVPLYIVEPKFDGLGVSCVWENGVLDRVLTRGDGEYGENVLHNCAYLQGVDRVIDKDEAVLELRGEAVMKKSVFESVNSRLIGQGEKGFSNPRNCASGVLRHIHAEKEERGDLSVFFYECPEKHARKSLGIKLYSDTIAFLQEQGIPCSPEYFECKNLKEVMDAIVSIENMRASLDYDIDGAVVKINSYALRERVGATAHHPRWAVAWKFPATQATTRVEKIEWQVGRTGVLTPVAHLDPVEINGVQVARATLHNFDTIVQKDIREGDTVFVERSGDVIPKITSVVLAKRKEGTLPQKRPEQCGECGSKIIQKQGEVAIRCSNKQCPKRVVEQLIHFASKKAMNITGLGDAVCQQLISKGLVHTVADLFRLTEKEVGMLDGFKEKSIQNLLRSVDTSRKNPFWRVLHGLGIPHVGVQTAKVLAREYSGFQDLQKASVEEFAQINDVGEKMGEEIVRFINDPDQKNILKELESVMSMKDSTPQKKRFTSDLSGKKIVLTGTLKKCSRDQATEYIEQAGGIVVSSLSAKTDYVLAGEKAGSKKQKAEDLGVKILLEEEFWEMVMPHEKGQDNLKNDDCSPQKQEKEESSSPIALF